ncbi:MAG TPA: TIGR02444 family protein [Dongiaceae bacterium]|nr:TIGR02444 family protein [Dongiaceae bacterium]
MKHGAEAGKMGTPSFATDFWAFSLRFYGQAPIQDLCLRLQNMFGADVNLVLLCCYAGEQGRALDKSGIAALDAQIRNWRERVIVPLRRARKYARDEVGKKDVIYRGLYSAEMEAEKRSQYMLAQHLSSHAQRVSGSRATLVRQALEAYLCDFLGRDRAAADPLIAGLALEQPSTA